VARYGPRQIVLYELSEFALYGVEQDLTHQFPQVALVRLIGDVKDLAHLRATMTRFGPQVIFHAAAYKHVPLMEEHNSAAALHNNTLGTYRAALAAGECGVERFVLISTDKAVNPTSVMGATKRAAEVALSHLAREWPGTRFMAVRFGNVLGSSGSVIPKFKEQIARGGPVTVTHRDMTRYFMTIPEAARLVLQAAAIGETGQVYVLDMGEPVRIVDLARDMIRLAGHAPQEIGIVFSGLRPGEKLFEELLADADTTLPTPFPQLNGQQTHSKLSPEALGRAQQLHGDAEVRRWLHDLIAEYQPAAAETGYSSSDDSRRASRQP
jgi:FlaA1/EpsC-like NDP-sugar epimerase